jgi:hypothetical protein
MPCRNIHTRENNCSGVLYVTASVPEGVDTLNWRYRRFYSTEGKGKERPLAAMAALAKKRCGRSPRHHVMLYVSNPNPGGSVHAQGQFLSSVWAQTGLSRHTLLAVLEIWFLDFLSVLYFPRGEGGGGGGRAI